MDLRSLVDDALEVTVLGSFTCLGYAARRRLFAWKDLPPDALVGRTALVTGANSGLGLATSDALAAMGARVILLGRNEQKLTHVQAELIARHGGERFPVVVTDMASLASVRAGAAQILATEDRLDIIVDNAGAIFRERSESSDGIERTLATMVVGPFVLISELLPLLQRSGNARVIAVASGGMYLQAVNFDDIQWVTTPFDGVRAYASAKRIQIALVREWHRRMSASGLRVNAMHPGWADTPGVVAAIPGFYGLMGPLLRTPAQGADTIVWLAAGPRAGERGGQLFLDRRPRPFDRLPQTRLDGAARRRLWDIVVGLAGSTTGNANDAAASPSTNVPAGAEPTSGAILPNRGAAV